MKRSEFHFELPPGLIAQQPLKRRSDSRLLRLSRDQGKYSDHRFAELPDLLEPGDLLVFNDTRVIPARLFAHKETGGRVEILIERLLGEQECIVQLKASKTPRDGSMLLLEDETRLEVIGREGSFFRLRSQVGVSELMERLGHVPLPPYIDREDAAMDRERYQTVYARRPGAVAAPTAGLHFDESLIAALDRKGVERVSLTLHVGAGTFQPVRVDDIEAHEMHAEYLEVPASVCAAVEAARARGGRVIAVGTTAVRSMETAAGNSGNGRILQPFRGDSRIFIYPGYQFLVVDGIVTNFHLPESTLLMLVSAFAGMDEIRAAYSHAIEERYRFFSYGDAMLIL
jgi:S-adenosylmethionine:tRNA ribosyltransferase-isomerase